MRPFSFWLQVRSSAFARMVAAQPLLLFFQGQLLHEAMRRARVTEADLRQALREHGLGSFEAAEAIVLEPNGRFAVIKTASLDAMSDFPAE